mmetsp:Transcript_26969/g.71229  ORF Transcript_26969/g.71229 Transcript_26969/m.71229 type:complete len:130 (+) Transcript_26969:284-673(+)
MGGKVEQRWLDKVSLAPFSTEQLHYLMQCHGMNPQRVTSATPVAHSAAAACELLPKPMDMWSTVGMVAAVAVMLMAIVRWCFPGILEHFCPAAAHAVRAHGKLKREDFSAINQEETELVDAEVIGAAGA